MPTSIIRKSLASLIAKGCHLGYTSPTVITSWFPDKPHKFSGIKLKHKLGTKLLPVVEPEYNPEDATTAATANAGLSLDLPPAPDPITTGPPTNVNEGDVDQPSQNYDCVKIEEMEENKGGN